MPDASAGGAAPDERHWMLTLMSWIMLAASTVGPGSVVVCSKTGADFQMQLLWCLVVACGVAYVLLEAAARMVIVSGQSLGQAMIKKFGYSPTAIPIICYIAAMGVLVGNSFYSANSFAGGMTAAYVMQPNTAWFRWLVTLLWAGLLVVLLFFGDVDRISSSLGIVVCVMTVTFGIGALGITVDPAAMLAGLIPSIPKDSATLVLSTVGTTAIPFNLFLAGSIAEGNTVESMRFGIRIATAVMFTSSFLITIVGSGVHKNPEDMEHQFKVADLVAVLRESAGERAVICFAVGLFCAAFSAAIGATMAAALTAQSLLEKSDFEISPGERDRSKRQIEEAKEEKKWGEKGIRFRSTLLLVIGVGAMTSGFDLPTVPVVLMCQVVNGILLPFLSTCLILCVNDTKIMSQEPQTPFQNACLALAVTFTVFLACVGLIDNIFDISVAEIDKDEDLIFSIAGVVTVCYFMWLCGMLYLQIIKREEGYFRVNQAQEENENDDDNYQDDASSSYQGIIKSDEKDTAIVGGAPGGLGGGSSSGNYGGVEVDGDIDGLTGLAGSPSVRSKKEKEKSSSRKSKSKSKSKSRSKSSSSSSSAVVKKDSSTDMGGGEEDYV